ncbi:MAG TPA: glycosyltransferase 87 family protein, partial [Chloroflexia bacterium]|nr:glycosyltransferase 87 family protein [Chloroflexia bacterium]
QPLDAPLLYPYPYAPFVAVLNAPFAAQSPLLAMAIWDVINIVCMALGLWVLLSALPLARLTRYLLLLGGLTCFPFIVNLEQGQSSGVIMFGMAVGIARLRRGDDLGGGVALGLLLLKLQWLPFLVLVLLFKGRWRALLGIAATGLALLLLSLLTISTGWIPGFLDMLQRAQRFDPALALTPWASHSLTGQLAALFFGTDANVNAAGNEVIRNITLVATLLAAGLVVVLWRGQWRPGSRNWDGAMSITILAAAFTNLQLNTHDLCLLALPAALGVAYFRASAGQESLGRVWYGLVLITYLATSLAFPLLFAAPLRLMPLLLGLMMVLVTVSLLRSHAPASTAT